MQAIVSARYMMEMKLKSQGAVRLKQNVAAVCDSEAGYLVLPSDSCNGNKGISKRSWPILRYLGTREEKSVATTVNAMCKFSSREFGWCSNSQPSFPVHE
jgi:hypothetical protein